MVGGKPVGLIEIFHHDNIYIYYEVLISKNGEEPKRASFQRHRILGFLKSHVEAKVPETGRAARFEGKLPGRGKKNPYSLGL